MSGGDDPSSPPAAADAHARIARVEREVHLLRVGLIVLAFASVAAFASLLLYFTMRRLEPHVDTLYAHRFVLEHEGKTRAELSMHAAGWPQLLLEPDTRSKPGVAIGGRGELVVRGDSGWRTHVFGPSIQFSGPGDQVGARFEQGPGNPGWIFYDDAGRRVFTMHTSKGLQRTLLDSAAAPPSYYR